MARHRDLTWAGACVAASGRGVVSHTLSLTRHAITDTSTRYHQHTHHQHTMTITQTSTHHDCHTHTHKRNITATQPSTHNHHHTGINTQSLSHKRQHNFPVTQSCPARFYIISTVFSLLRIDFVKLNMWCCHGLSGPFSYHIFHIFHIAWPHVTTPGLARRASPRSPWVPPACPVAARLEGHPEPRTWCEHVRASGIQPETFAQMAA